MIGYMYTTNLLESYLIHILNLFNNGIKNFQLLGIIKFWHTTAKYFSKLHWERFTQSLPLKKNINFWSSILTFKTSLLIMKELPCSAIITKQLMMLIWQVFLLLTFASWKMNIKAKKLIQNIILTKWCLTLLVRLEFIYLTQLCI